MLKKTIWSLFDSGNGCYTKTIKKEFESFFENYAFGIDVENKNNHFVNLNLADFSDLFKETSIFDKLDAMSKPDIILASPPCESWSTASSIKNGNVCWLNTSANPGQLTIQTKKNIDNYNNTHSFFKKVWNNTVLQRVNGEMCAFNTQRIIERYKPKFWVIENPQSSKIWRYYEHVLNFEGIKNVAHYSAYSDEFSKKPTIFYSNMELDLKKATEKAKFVLRSKDSSGSNRKAINGYNKRSNIPESLICDILEQILKKYKEKQ